MVEQNLLKFLDAMEAVYGPLREITEPSAASWTPPPTAGGHRGRYLWTDAFGVINFLTLYRTTAEKRYLNLATRLVETVHDILSRTRDGSARLPGASDAHPLAGGLRIGKEGEEDQADGDGDGQYHHYLTLWMFALNRVSLASGDKSFNERAIELARAIHPAFVVHRSSGRPRMYWKVSMDLKRPLVKSEGNLDPMDGYTVFTLLSRTAGDPQTLGEEIADYKKIVAAKVEHYTSDDPLDLGMTLWTSHWLKDEEVWAHDLSKKAASCLRNLSTVDDYFDLPLRYRLPFREFGAVLGIRCLRQSSLLLSSSPPSSFSPPHDPEPEAKGESQYRKQIRRRSQSQDDVHGRDLDALASKTVAAWESAGAVPLSSEPAEAKTASAELVSQSLLPITYVMYAAALIPGAFRKECFA